MLWQTREPGQRPPLCISLSFATSQWTASLHTLKGMKFSAVRAGRMIYHFQGLPATYLIRVCHKLRADWNPTIPKVVPDHSRFFNVVLQLRYKSLYAFPSIHFPWKSLRLENRKNQTFSPHFTFSLAPANNSKLTWEQSLPRNSAASGSGWHQEVLRYV